MFFKLLHSSAIREAKTCGHANKTNLDSCCQNLKTFGFLLSSSRVFLDYAAIRTLERIGDAPEIYVILTIAVNKYGYSGGKAFNSLVHQKEKLT